MGLNKRSYQAIPAHMAEDSGLQNSIGLLISILVRYPEVGTVRYNPEAQTLKFTFILKVVPPRERQRRFFALFRESLQAFYGLTGREPLVFELERQVYRNFTLLELKRDIATLSQEEISLFTGLVRDEFSDVLLTEENEPLQEEERLFQEEMIEHMLEDMRESKLEKDLIGFREEGRVFVFNKGERVSDRKG
ncbi:MAG: hypothetical protein QJR13_08445 [Bacillota bacterium]|nr:hypothetical protein [Bacillota bacterium]